MALFRGPKRGRGRSAGPASGATGHMRNALHLVLSGDLAGATLAGLACSLPIVRYRLRLRRSRQRIAELEQELHGLRTLPLGDEAEGEPRAREA